MRTFDEIFEDLYCYPDNFYRFLEETGHPLKGIVNLRYTDQYNLMRTLDHPTLRPLVTNYERWLERDIETNIKA
jgi:hypothetical protein